MGLSSAPRRALLLLTAAVLYAILGFGAGASLAAGAHRSGHHRHHRCAAAKHGAHKRHHKRCALRNHSGIGATARGVQSKGPGSLKHAGAPLNQSPPVISGSATQGQTLTAAPGSWSGTNPITYAYQWRRGGSSIAGATHATYLLSAADVGYRIDVVVTASNAAGSASATSASTAPVGPASSEPPPPPPAPSVASLSPSSGPQAGGTTITIAGSNFSGATAVRFGALASGAFSVNSASSITAVAPAGSGTVDVSVTTAGGTSALSAADRFTYTAPPPPPPGAAGAVRFVKFADSSFDAEDIQSNAAFMWEHFTRMVGFTSFFDSRTVWAPPAWVYQDAYAIYVGSSLEKEHPEWILRDASGNPLYIPFGNPPTQLAADISNPAFRRFWIERTKAILAHGYRGVYVDDVDMWANTGNAKDEKVTPISGVTGQPISNEGWREYLATFMRELREATPGYEIVHNNVWYAGASSGNRGTTNALVRAQVEAADVLNLERGANDSGLTGGTGAWSLFNLFTYIDELHALGRAVTLEGSSREVSGMEYNLAAYFLISTGRDYVTGGGSAQNVTNFWPGWSVNLGEASGPRERSGTGLWTRRFTGGVVYLLEPGAVTQTISLPSVMRSVTLGSVSSITLSARQGAVLLTG
jgi:hypothetical protein